ncbi:hypothetical protein EV702DRAFT_1213152 [Suillus placidus]|uniref:MARVEL domain-containing protein n=1 Tax=Suillus placidus TaxID=48579 RepID=A0A9P7A086_9AGAM|nr:hypothetical protein EV702DRAFT_1213152 [Suillus placidus]
MVLKIVRWFILTFTLILAIVVLGISGHLLAIRPTDYWRFAALAVAVSSVTILTFPVILIVNSFTGVDSNITQERIMGEAAWLTIMWILWLSTGANATRAARVHFLPGACSLLSGYPNQICNEFKVVEAFAYINFIILLCYMVGLVVYEFMRDESQGNVETRQVKQSQVQQRLATSVYATNDPLGQQPQP